MNSVEEPPAERSGYDISVEFKIQVSCPVQKDKGEVHDDDGK